MPAVMFESEKVNVVWILAIVDRVRKTTHEMTPHPSVDHSPTVWRFQYERDRSIRFFKKLNPEG